MYFKVVFLILFNFVNIEFLTAQSKNKKKNSIFLIFFVAKNFLGHTHCIRMEKPSMIQKQPETKNMAQV